MIKAKSKVTNAKQEQKLVVQDLYVEVDGKEILHGVDLEINLGKVHALMGPNGAGKSCLANTLMGNPVYKVTKGKIILNGEDITKLDASERAKRGLFLSFQYPSEVSGVTLSNFLRTAYNALNKTNINVLEFHKMLKQRMAELQMDPSFVKRYLNEGFSGGEKKKAEILQMSILQPKYAILDECDSGLDITAIKIIGESINEMQSKDRAVLIITHYYRILKYLSPDEVSILVDGKIVKTGGNELAHEIEEHGFKSYPSKNKEIEAK